MFAEVRRRCLRFTWELTPGGDSWWLVEAGVAGNRRTLPVQQCWRLPRRLAPAVLGPPKVALIGRPVDMGGPGASPGLACFCPESAFVREVCLLGQLEPVSHGGSFAGFIGAESPVENDSVVKLELFPFYLSCINLLKLCRHLTTYRILP